MKWDIALWMIIILLGAMLMSAGIKGESIERTVGGWSVAEYHGHDGDPDLPPANANVDQFYNKMGQYGWTKWARYKDDYAWESSFEDALRGGHDTLQEIWNGGIMWGVDSVNLAYFCGHGSPYGIYFGTNHQSLPSGSSYAATIYEVRWGDGDLDQIVLDSCHVLQYKSGFYYYWERWDDPSGYPDESALTIHAGLHVMMGWHSVGEIYNCWMYGFESRGGIFADKIHNHYTVWSSWNQATKQAKPWWDWSTYRAAIMYGKIYKNGQEVFRYSNENFWNPYNDPTWYEHHGYTLARGYSSWNV